MAEDDSQPKRRATDDLAKELDALKKETLLRFSENAKLMDDGAARMERIEKNQMVYIGVVTSTQEDVQSLRNGLAENTRISRDNMVLTGNLNERFDKLDTGIKQVLGVMGAANTAGKWSYGFGKRAGMVLIYISGVVGGWEITKPFLAKLAKFFT